MQEKNFHNFIIDKALHPEIEMHIKDPCKEEILVNDLDLCYFCKHLTFFICSK